MEITAQQQGVGVYLTITLLPDDVNFANLEVKELPGPARNLIGYFDQPKINELGETYHKAKVAWQGIDRLNQYGDTAAFYRWPKITVDGNL